MDIHGFVAPGFESVHDAFAQNFEKGLEVGAAFTTYHRGEKVVDLWGGVADPATGTPWTEDTLVLVFSTTKGATAICANRLAQQGALDFDAPVANYWPEFAQAGKEAIPVSQLLCHEAGLPWVDEPLTLEQALAWDPMIHALEHQVPVWEPGTRHGYHAVTFGYLVGEVVRRVTGSSIGSYFADEIARPLGLDFWIGLPEREERRVAPLIGDLAGDSVGAELDEPGRSELAKLLGPDSALGKALTAGGAFRGAGIFNTRAVHAAEVPAAGGITDARSIARMFAATIGDVDGVRLLTPEQMTLASTQRTRGPNTVLLDLDLQFGLGFFVPSSLLQLGGPKSFGHFGAGGSMGWADPEAELAFGYAMNKMDLGLAGDLRSYSLVNACYSALS
ncbi:MAG TPA: serine hydrolase domain-containing protein [Acidimicrobiia bacterium]|jgi:CubicO group peptidase (beta-lactamase class C family)